jgi:hypothetical protein
MSWFKNPWNPDDGAYGEENASNHGYLKSRLKNFFQQAQGRPDAITVYFAPSSLNLITSQSTLLNTLGRLINRINSTVPIDAFAKGGDSNIGNVNGTGAMNALSRATNVASALNSNPSATVSPTLTDIQGAQNQPVPRKSDFEFLGNNSDIVVISIITQGGSAIPNQLLRSWANLKQQIEAIRP